MLMHLQTLKEAKDYFKRKIEFIAKQIEKIQPLVMEKQSLAQGKL